MHFAHSTNSTEDNWEPLARHLHEVAELARSFGSKFGGGNAAELAGLLHDLGKYAAAFQEYIRGQRARGVDHASAGAQQVIKLATGINGLVARLLAYAIAGHHGGLPDQHGSAGLDDRLKKQLEPIDAIWRSELQLNAAALLPTPFKPYQGDAAVPERMAFQFAFLGRMLFSCLVDADFLCTEAFYARTEGRQVDRAWPGLAQSIDGLNARFDSYIADKQQHAPNTPLNALRRDILNHVRRKAELPRGVFTLNVPTGGGKTLASLAFALNHAKRHQMDRIVYTIPFTAIIEQTAGIFRNVLGDDVLLEHHSAIELDPSKAQNKAGEEYGIDDGARDGKLRLAAENWAAPIVVTTNVQFFESLFASRGARCRKLHNLANAVIILDEAQTIPLNLLRPCVAALDELVRNYGCTVVLCTATLPALGADRFKGGLVISPDRELAPDPAALHNALRRTTQRLAGTMTDDQLLEDIAQSGTAQALVIVNSRKHALALFERAQQRGIDGLLHLTTRQIAADRRLILADIRQRLVDNVPCVVIATSLVEAGVDLDFPRVWRAEAGLDQVVQAAGRCNREGRAPADASIVTIFKPAEAKPPAEIEALIGDTYRILETHKGDLFAPAAVEAYFGEVHWRLQSDGLDRIKIADADGRKVAAQTMQQFSVSAGQPSFGYRTVGDAFRLIESGMAPVIVPTDAEALDTLAALRGGLPPTAAARRLRNYLVQVPPRERQRMIDNGHVRFVEADRFGEQFAVLETTALYSATSGLRWEDADEFTWGIV
ncbi:CRISPR-associated helicase/endonuclease Cas3 [Rhodopseudomonas pseudopalustris]|uniref:CRISPR-associated helicase, Cas3 family n=1 Tax=Rhodopseudomonas pseudopalustris TaxID=1513892 RepID=A0A1H8UHB0_9BRAD|nr:CRISPR-associated helicase/endonuclease Cas3 [Rhodopseudomonas pseudopalustris]SEP02622.1 CRISPR-associated helicase, Cas3 family [Rhodopseudomonas pseudopalustris]